MGHHERGCATNVKPTRKQQVCKRAVKVVKKKKKKRETWKSNAACVIYDAFGDFFLHMFIYV